MSKRPTLRKQDLAKLSPTKRSIPAYGKKPFVGRDTELFFSHLTGTGSKRDPWGIVVTDGTHFWHLEPEDVVRVESERSHSTVKYELDTWLDHNDYQRGHKTPHPYTGVSSATHARRIMSPATGREIFAAKERDHHITTHGRQLLRASQFALPPTPEETRRGIKGRLPIDTLPRARNALARAAQMRKRGHISAAQLATLQRKIHAVWPSIGGEV